MVVGVLVLALSLPARAGEFLLPKIDFGALRGAPAPQDYK